jgi:hypothetical protein
VRACSGESSTCVTRIGVTHALVYGSMSTSIEIIIALVLVYIVVYVL